MSKLGRSSKLEFWDYQVTHLVPVVPQGGSNAANEQIRLHEKAKKGAFLSHTTAFGKQVPSGHTNVVRGQKTSTLPVFVAVIEYRSRMLLETIDGLNLPPAPQPVADPAPLPLPIVKEPAVKRERTEPVGNEGLQAAKKYKTAVEKGVLTVDLTEDDD